MLETKKDERDYFKEGNNNKLKEIVKLVSLVQLITWFIFILIDFVDEYYGYKIKLGRDFADIGVLIIPICISVIYFFYEKKLCNKFKMSQVTLDMLLSLIWIIETAVIGTSIWCLVDNRVWIIKQHSRDVFFDLNGLEYFLFPFMIGIIPVIFIIIRRIIMCIYKFIKGIFQKGKNNGK